MSIVDALDEENSPYSCCFIGSLFIFSNLWIVRSTRDRVFFDLNKVPHHRIALVLGTSHRTTKGDPNPFFERELKQLPNFTER